MSRLYNITVIGRDEPATWLTAAAFAAQDLRVALALERAPDPGLDPFPALPFNAGRQAGLMAAAGLKPAGPPFPAWTPEFQVITNEGIMDLIAEPGHWERSLLREFQGMTRSFLDRVHELEQMAAHATDSARAKGFPYRTGPNNGGLLRRLVPGSQPWTPPSTPPFSQWSQGLTLGQTRTILAVASAALGAEISADAPVLTIALLWNVSRDFFTGNGVNSDLREQAAAAVAKRGTIIEAVPDALIHQGKNLRSVRLRGGSVIDTQVLIANRTTLDSILGPNLEWNPNHAGPGFVHATIFFKLERTTIPESLAERSIIVRDLMKPLSGDNFLVLTRQPRVPARETLAVSMIDPPAGLEEEQVPEIIAQTLPWLDPNQMVLDDTRPPIVVRKTTPALDLATTIWPRTSLENLFPLPDDVMTGWGPAGLPVAISSLTAVVSDLLKKYKNRKW